MDAKMRTQDNYDPQQNSDDNGTPGGGPLITRQEYLADSDINTLIKRFGVDGHARQPLFGVLDFDRGLQQAFDDIHNANKLFNSLPAELQPKYRSLADVMAGLADGTFTKDIEEALTKRNAPNLQEEITWLRERITGLKSSSSDQSTAPSGSSPNAAADGQAPSAPK